MERIAALKEKSVNEYSKACLGVNCTRGYHAHLFEQQIDSAL